MCADLALQQHLSCLMSPDHPPALHPPFVAAFSMWSCLPPAHLHGTSGLFTSCIHMDPLTLTKLLRPRSCRVAVGSRTRLEDLQALLALSEAFSAMIEASGCKPVSALRSAVQLQCKAAIDGLHQHNIQQLTGEAGHVIHEMIMSGRG